MLPQWWRKLPQYSKYLISSYLPPSTICSSLCTISSLTHIHKLSPTSAVTIWKQYTTPIIHTSMGLNKIYPIFLPILVIITCSMSSSWRKPKLTTWCQSRLTTIWTRKKSSCTWLWSMISLSQIWKLLAITSNFFVVMIVPSSILLIIAALAMGFIMRPIFAKLRYYSTLMADYCHYIHKNDMNLEITEEGETSDFV